MNFYPAGQGEVVLKVDEALHAELDLKIPREDVVAAYAVGPHADQRVVLDKDQDGHATLALDGAVPLLEGDEVQVYYRLSQDAVTRGVVLELE